MLNTPLQLELKLEDIFERKTPSGKVRKLKFVGTSSLKVIGRCHGHPGQLRGRGQVEGLPRGCEGHRGNANDIVFSHALRLK